jgi:hypothetical protein
MPLRVFVCGEYLKGQRGHQRLPRVTYRGFHQADQFALPAAIIACGQHHYCACAGFGAGG